MIRLPYPPSMNTYLRHLPNGRTLLSERGRSYHTTVWEVVKRTMPGHAPLLGPLAVTLTAFPPDKRRRDLDNLPKVVLDSLTKAGAWKDDSQIQRLTIQWGAIWPGGALEVEIEELAPHGARK